MKTHFLNLKSKFICISDLNLNFLIWFVNIFFIITACLDLEPNIYLFMLESQGFKMADVDESELKYVTPIGYTDFLFKKEGNNAWQILDSVQREKVFFVTINYYNANPNLIIWSLSNK